MGTENQSMQNYKILTHLVNAKETSLHQLQFADGQQVSLWKQLILGLNIFVKCNSEMLASVVFFRDRES